MLLDLYPSEQHQDLLLSVGAPLIDQVLDGDISDAPTICWFINLMVPSNGVDYQCADTQNKVTILGGA